MSRLLDGIVDWAVIGFASWTLLYQLARGLGWGTDPVLIGWLLALLPIGWCLAHRAGVRTGLSLRSGSATPRPAPGHQPPTPVSDRRSNAGLPGWLRPVGLAAGLVSAPLVVARSGWWSLAWALAAVSVGVAGWQLWRSRTDLDAGGSEGVRAATAGPRWRPEGAWPTCLVALVGTGWAVLSLFLVRPDADDTFYVNKAVFVGERGQIPLRDTIFGDQTLPPLPGAGTAPLQSLEVFQGSLAHLLGVQAGTVVYLVLPPLCSFLVTWVIWRLIREWAPVRALLCFVVAMVYLALTAQGGATVGLFFVGRIWQGKAIFVAALVPLIYLYLTRWSRTGDRKYLLLLPATGVSCVGMTSSATFVVPIIAVAAAVGLGIAGRRWAGGLLVAAYPVASGGVLFLIGGAPGDPGGGLLVGEDALHLVLGVGLLAAIGWLGVFAAWWVVGTSTSRALTAAAAAAFLVVLLPPFAAAFGAATGAGAVAWRLVWVAPVTVMVGLLAAVPLPSSVGSGNRRAAVGTGLSALPAAAVIIVLVLAGTPVWTSPTRGPLLAGAPSWKYSPEMLDRANAIVALAPGPGPVLTNTSEMRGISLVTSRVPTVAARSDYVPLLTEPVEQHQARILLGELFGGEVPGDHSDLPELGPESFRAALDALDVSMVCLRPNAGKELVSWVQGAGWSTEMAADLTCYRRP